MWPSYLRVMIVGDKPSKYNTSPSIAFKGSRSGVTLGKWLDTMGVKPDGYTAINRTDDFFKEAARSFVKLGLPVISVGKHADKALTDAGIPHFSLPHPSGLNRGNNDTKRLGLLLGKCRRYIDTIEGFHGVS